MKNMVYTDGSPSREWEESTKIIDQQVRAWTRLKHGTAVYRIFADVLNGDRSIEQCRKEIEEGKVVE